MLLQVEDLAISYTEGRNTVEGVNFSLDQGEVLTIVGESGSGKTSVIRAVLGCLGGGGKAAGSIRFQDKELTKLSVKEWLDLRGKTVSMIFQDSGNMMNPVQTIGRQFIEYLQIHSEMSRKEAYDYAVQMLKKMNLAHAESIMDSYVFELSGGMRQRVGIAIAIAFHPQLLLADEPTSALDVTTQAQIVEELKRIVKESQTAMIMVTHNIGVAAYLSDKIMVMAQGKVVEYGTAAEVIENPKADYTKELLAAVPTIGGKRYVE